MQYLYNAFSLRYSWKNLEIFLQRKERNSPIDSNASWKALLSEMVNQENVNQIQCEYNNAVSLAHGIEVIDSLK